MEKPKNRTTLYVLLAAGAAAVLLLGCGGVVGLAVLAGRSSPAGKTYTRDEFRKLVVGKTPEDVRKAVGQPDRTSDLGDGDVYWYYGNRTYDPANGKPDNAQVVFERGKAVRVNY